MLFSSYEAKRVKIFTLLHLHINCKSPKILLLSYIYVLIFPVLKGVSCNLLSCSLCRWQ